MKKLIIILVMLCNYAYAQYTPMRSKYEYMSVIQIDSMMRTLGFADTATLNTYRVGGTLVSTQPGWLVRVGNNYYMRNTAGDAWLQFVNIGSGSSSSTNVWLTTGNVSPTDPSSRILGHIDSFPIRMFTDSTLRMSIPAGGINRNATARYKYLMRDTAGTFDLAYGDAGYGSPTGWDDMLAVGQPMSTSRDVELSDGQLQLLYGLIGSSTAALQIYTGSGAYLVNPAQTVIIGSSIDSAQILQTHTGITDTTKYKPFGVSTSGGLVRMNSWPGSGGGSGTVTSVSGLSTLFTVTNPTTTPTFVLSNAGAKTLFGRSAGIGAPSYLTSIDSTWIPTLHSEAYYNTKYGSSTPTLTTVLAAGNHAPTDLFIDSDNGQLGVYSATLFGAAYLYQNNTGGGYLGLLNQSGFGSEIQVDNVTGSVKAIQMPNASGTLALNPLTTNGDMIYGVGSTATRLAAGTAAQTLHGGTVPAWKDTVAITYFEFDPLYFPLTTVGDTVQVGLQVPAGAGEVLFGTGSTYTSSPDITTNGFDINFGGNMNAGAVTSNSDVTATGNVTGANLAAGTHSATVSNTTNVTSSTMRNFIYSRYGNVVTYTATVTVTTTLAIATSFELDLPITSTFTDQYNAGGTLTANAAILSVPAVRASVANGTIAVSFMALSVGGSGTITITGQYVIL